MTWQCRCRGHKRPQREPEPEPTSPEVRAAIKESDVALRELREWMEQERRMQATPAR